VFVVESLHGCESLLELEGGLSVEVERVDVDLPVFSGALHEEHVRGELRVLLDLDELAQLELVPLPLHPLLPLVIVHLDPPQIHLPVLPVTTPVLKRSITHYSGGYLISLLKHGKEQHYCEGRYHRSWVLY
jgi:hypothetical protein